MAHVNDNYLKLKAGYLFPEIGRRVAAFAKENPTAKIIRMGIGDVTEPLPAAVVEAMHKAVDEMTRRETFRGYGPEQGYDFLRDAIARNDYHAHRRDTPALARMGGLRQGERRGDPVRRGVRGVHQRPRCASLHL